MVKVIPGCTRQQAPSLQVNWVVAFYLALYFIHSSLWSIVDSWPAILMMSDHVVTHVYLTASVCVAYLHFYWIASILILFMHFTPLDDKGFEFKGQWAFNCLVSMFSLYPRYLSLQGQACSFESLSSAPVQWLSGCLRRSFHNPQLTYRYTFLCVHVLGMAVTVENGASWRAVLACCFLLVDTCNIVNFKIKFWYTMRVCTITIKAACLNLYSMLGKVIFFFIFSNSYSWKFCCDHLVITIDEILSVDTVHIVHHKCSLIL